MKHDLKQRSLGGLTALMCVFGLSFSNVGKTNQPNSNQINEAWYQNLQQHNKKIMDQSQSSSDLEQAERKARTGLQSAAEKMSRSSTAMPVIESLNDAQRAQLSQAAKAEMDKAQRQAQGRLKLLQHQLGQVQVYQRGQYLDLSQANPQSNSSAAGLIDPAQIAQSFAGLNLLERSPFELRIFVSLSMPKVSLLALAKDARTIGAMLVFRGLPNGLNGAGARQDSVKNAAKNNPAKVVSPWMDMYQQLGFLRATGANLQIDPTAFARYDIESVPSFVMSRPDQNTACSAGQCQNTYAKAVGEQKLREVLEDWMQNFDETQAQANEGLINPAKNKTFSAQAQEWVQKLKESE
jgi:type-F conjugative transfer system pilin assembly protein TrbC